MFKLESYITPIILSQVERYVKNIKAEDSQVSLWGGDAVFNNLDLRLDVLEDELRLPFSLVSGHIHELQIHVPWTRLNTEPIVLTINTIECVLKLPTDRASSGLLIGIILLSLKSTISVSSEGTAGSTDDSIKGDEKKKARKKREDQAAPPGYIQSLVNKIISNIQIVCNNLILKYVEDDLVLSLNVRTVSYVSCDQTWSPAFTELSLPDLILRKLISVSDLTICLDRRGTTGKIEVYQDPLLYRCSMAVRLSWVYHAINAKAPFKSVINLLADKMDFSMTGLQVPMVVRLFKLFLAFYYGDMVTKHELERRRSKGAELEEGESETHDPELDQSGSLGNYLWDVGSSLGTALLPVYWEDEDNPGPEQTPAPGLASTLAVYIREASLSLKLAANVKQKGFYRGGKQCFNSYLSCKLGGLFSEVRSRGATWVNVRAGLCSLQVSPVGSPQETVAHYILTGAESERFMEGSLFDQREETQRRPSVGEKPDWDSHLETVSEAALVERSPALAMDYLYNLDIPGDLGSEDLTELTEDMEHSNLPEQAMCRVVLGPGSLHVTQGCVARVRTVTELIRDYEYIPYVQPSPLPGT